MRERGGHLAKYVLRLWFFRDGEAVPDPEQAPVAVALPRQCTSPQYLQLYLELIISCLDECEKSSGSKYKKNSGQIMSLWGFNFAGKKQISPPIVHKMEHYLHNVQQLA